MKHMELINWSKYIKWGKFTSTHGIELPYKWEFDKLEKEKHDEEIILSCILGLIYPSKLIGIDTIHPKSLEKYCSAIYYPKTNVFENIENPIDKNEDYVIFDDVITTGITIKKCIEKLDIRPVKIICIIDRRKEILDLSKKEPNLNVISIERDILK